MTRRENKRYKTIPYMWCLQPRPGGKKVSKRACVYTHTHTHIYTHIYTHTYIFTVFQSSLIHPKILNEHKLSAKRWLWMEQIRGY